ncbi:MAG: ferrochelatase [Myxococcales bacterium]|nr:ferrochelatase [Myxococcales bacterium]MCB9580906.1 ferrochelatase [Polyangiaceae bacterium]
MGPKDGVLLVAHGTVSDLDDLPAFVARIRRGRPAPPGLVEELRHRYEVIGGSPLLDLTKAQAQGLSERLAAPVLVGMRLWQPGVEEVVRAAVSLGLQRLCVIPLAPFSVHVYAQAADEALERVRPELKDATPSFVHVDAWGQEPAFVKAHVESIARRVAPGTRVVLTAHSLPRRAITAGDPYEAQFRACAEAVGKQLDAPWEIAFQSQGADGGDWLGPDILQVLERLAGEGVRRAVVAPIGFLAEHVETLFDLDVEAKAHADRLGVELVRVPALNTAPGLLEALEAVTRRALS